LDEYRRRGDLITADNAEPKSIADFKAWDFNMRPTIKGPDSVRYSVQWLQHLTAIHIDPERCPHTATEFQSYEYLTDRDGQPLTGFPDINNHFIDAARYALVDIWKRRGM
jgi:phage terminase large subunit